MDNLPISSTSAAAIAEEESRATVEYDEAGEVKPPQPKKQDSEVDKITVRAVDQSGREVYIKVKRSTAVERLIDAYCKRSNIKPEALRFIVDGNRMIPGKTIQDYELEDNDVIDVVLQQTGGW